MKRAALLQLPGNPFILSYWLRNYERVWKDEVDELHVFVNGAKRQEVASCTYEMVSAVGGNWYYQPGRLVHGHATQYLYNQTDADLLMLVEDDAFVTTAGRVGTALHDAERGYVTGSPRGGMSPELENFCVKKWGPNPVGPDGSNGYGLWPCFLFASREMLDGVWFGFPSQEWPAGAIIPGLDQAFSKKMHTDTFTASAFVLRARAADKLVYEGQWKELWLRNLPEMQERAGYDPPWFHAGGLSNEDYFNPGGKALGARAGIGDTLEGKDWAHRIWWIRRCVETAPRDLLPDLAAHYLRELDNLMAFCDVRHYVEEWGETAPDWISWDDGGE